MEGLYFPRRGSARGSMGLEPVLMLHRSCDSWGIESLLVVALPLPASSPELGLV